MKWLTLSNGKLQFKTVQIAASNLKKKTMQTHVVARFKSSFSALPKPHRAAIGFIVIGLLIGLIVHALVSSVKPDQSGSVVTNSGELESQKIHFDVVGVSKAGSENQGVEQTKSTPDAEGGGISQHQNSRVDSGVDLSISQVDMDKPRVKESSSANQTLPGATGEVNLSPNRPEREKQGMAQVVKPAQPEIPSNTKILNITKAERWLLEQAEGAYSLQMFGSVQKSAVENYIARMGSGKQWHLIETAHDGKPWFVALYGSYEGREAALKAVGSMSSTLQAQKPWAKPLAPLKKSIQN